MTEIKARIKGIPKPQPRTRSTKRGGRTWHYTPGTVNQWKSDIETQLWKHIGTRMLGPVYLEVIFLLPRPKAMNRKCDPDGRILHTKKPDIDNLSKALMDSLTAIQIWADDSQVCHKVSYKYYCAKDEEPGAELFVREITS